MELLQRFRCEGIIVRMNVKKRLDGSRAGISGSLQLSHLLSCCSEHSVEASEIELCKHFSSTYYIACRGLQSSMTGGSSFQA